MQQAATAQGGGGGGHKAARVLSAITSLRKLLNHPKLIYDALHRWVLLLRVLVCATVLGRTRKCCMHLQWTSHIAGR